MRAVADLALLVKAQVLAIGGLARVIQQGMTQLAIRMIVAMQALVLAVAVSLAAFYCSIRMVGDVHAIEVALPIALFQQGHLAIGEIHAALIGVAGRLQVHAAQPGIHVQLAWRLREMQLPMPGLAGRIVAQWRALLVHGSSGCGGLVIRVKIQGSWRLPGRQGRVGNGHGRGTGQDGGQQNGSEYLQCMLSSTLRRRR